MAAKHPPNLGLSFNNIAVSVADIDRSIAFYKGIFGFEELHRTFFEPVSAKVAFLARNDIKLELLEVEGSGRVAEVDAAPPDHLLAQGYKAIVFNVDDLSAFTQFLNSMSVDIIWSEQQLDEAGTLSTLLRDPDGNIINVFGGRND